MSPVTYQMLHVFLKKKKVQVGGIKLWSQSMEVMLSTRPTPSSLILSFNLCSHQLLTWVAGPSRSQEEEKNYHILTTIGLLFSIVQVHLLHAIQTLFCLKQNQLYIWQCKIRCKTKSKVQQENKPQLPWLFSLHLYCGECSLDQITKSHHTVAIKSNSKSSTSCSSVPSSAAVA